MDSLLKLSPSTTSQLPHRAWGGLLLLSIVGCSASAGPADADSLEPEDHSSLSGDSDSDVVHGSRDSGSTGGALANGGTLGGGGSQATGGAGMSSSGGSVAGTGGTDNGASGGTSPSDDYGDFYDENGITIYANQPTQPQINAASPGDVLLFQPGEHDKFEIDGWVSSGCDPLVLTSLDPENPATIKGSSNTTVQIENSEYVVVQNLNIEGGLYGIQVQRSEHIIILHNEISYTNQEGFKAKTQSNYVDFLGNAVHHTGRVNAKWGEGAYIGTAGEFDDTSYIWIEGNEFYETGHGEAVELKPNVEHSTIRDNYVHDIAPGTPEQTNEGAIVLSGSSNGAENWAEFNVVEDVTWGEGGEAGRHNAGASGIVAFDGGNYIHHNTVRSCLEYGIYLNGAYNNNQFNYVWDNDVSGSGYSDFRDSIKDKVFLSSPGFTNPHTRQSWCE